MGRVNRKKLLLLRSMNAFSSEQTAEPCSGIFYPCAHRTGIVVSVTRNLVPACSRTQMMPPWSSKALWVLHCQGTCLAIGSSGHKELFAGLLRLVHSYSPLHINSFYKQILLSLTFLFQASF